MNIATFICIIGGFVACIGGYGVKRNHDAQKKAAKDVVEKGDRRSHMQHYAIFRLPNLLRRRECRCFQWRMCR